MALTMTAARTRRIRCPACNHTGPEPAGGLILRIGVGGPTRILRRCGGCGAWKFHILERGSDTSGGKATKAPAAASADRELTLQELASYVSEDTMDIDTAEAIASSAAPESRKREMAAHVAEGALDKAEALRLLAL